jgi:hypothetical protein
MGSNSIGSKRASSQQADGFEVGVLDGFEGDGFEPDNDYFS